jgi:hypothetical protein
VGLEGKPAAPALEAARILRAILAAVPGSNRDDGGFTSVEHPVAESLGNADFVLPKGVVCDRCNRGRLAVFDQALGDFFLVKLRRTTLGVPNKDGKVPVTALQEDGRLEHFQGRPALTGPAPKSWKEERRDPVDPRWSVGTAAITGGRPLRGRYAEQISRALLKVGFEAAWPEQGELLMGEEFDQLREVILGTRSRHGYVFVANQVDERHSGLDVSFDAARDEKEGVAYLTVSAKLLGVRMVTDSLRSEPPVGLVEDLGYAAVF